MSACGSPVRGCDGRCAAPRPPPAMPQCFLRREAFVPEVYRQRQAAPRPSREGARTLGLGARLPAHGQRQADDDRTLRPHRAHTPRSRLSSWPSTDRCCAGAGRKSRSGSEIATPMRRSPASRRPADASRQAPQLLLDQLARRRERRVDLRRVRAAALRQLRPATAVPPAACAAARTMSPAGTRFATSGVDIARNVGLPSITAARRMTALRARLQAVADLAQSIAARRLWDSRDDDVDAVYLCRVRCERSLPRRVRSAALHRLRSACAGGRSPRASPRRESRSRALAPADRR